MRICAGVLLVILLLAGCKAEADETEAKVEGAGLAENETEISEDDSAIELPARFSLLEEGCATQIKAQDGGTCWVYAASTSMESSYRKINGEEISIDPLDILNAVFFGEGEREGYRLKVEKTAKDLGGWAWQIVETLSNGFGEYTLVDATSYDDADIDTVKRAIFENGGMNVAVSDSDSSKFGHFDGDTTLNDPDNDDFDHEAVIVGWEDIYPKNNFCRPAQQDGAWILQNSRGDKWGNGGLYYVSYETQFREKTIFVLSDDYSEVLSYDGGAENRICTGDETVVANIFPQEGKLKAVGTYTVEHNQKLTIEIYDEKIEELICSKVAEYPVGGYHVVELEEPVEVSGFAVVVRYSRAAPVEGEAWEDSLLSYSVGAENGESFVCIDGEWKDMADAGTRELLGIDFEPNNCAVKALFGR